MKRRHVIQSVLAAPPGCIPGQRPRAHSRRFQFRQRSHSRRRRRRRRLLGGNPQRLLGRPQRHQHEQRLLQSLAADCAGRYATLVGILRHGPVPHHGERALSPGWNRCGGVLRRWPGATLRRLRSRAIPANRWRTRSTASTSSLATKSSPPTRTILVCSRRSNSAGGASIVLKRSFVPLGMDDLYRRFEQAVTPKTKVILVCHANRTEPDFPREAHCGHGSRSRHHGDLRRRARVQSIPL